jgi:hypothetical protein
MKWKRNNIVIKEPIEEYLKKCLKILLVKEYHLKSQSVLIHKKRIHNCNSNSNFNI